MMQRVDPCFEIKPRNKSATSFQFKTESESFVFLFSFCNQPQKSLYKRSFGLVVSKIFWHLISRVFLNAIWTLEILETGSPVCNSSKKQHFAFFWPDNACCCLACYGASCRIMHQERLSKVICNLIGERLIVTWKQKKKRVFDVFLGFLEKISKKAKALYMLVDGVKKLSPFHQNSQRQRRFKISLKMARNFCGILIFFFNWHF